MKQLAQDQIRRVRTWIPGKTPASFQAFNADKSSQDILDLASNDYLGLSRHPQLIAAANEIMHVEGVGAGGSRLVTGSRPIHKKLEEALGEWLGREKVLLFPSGFQANIGAVIALADRHTPVLADKLIHHSLLVGIKASGAKLQRYSHNNLLDLEKYLKIFQEKYVNKSPLVITESLFSMAGTSPNISELAKLCEKYKARLLVDEAHALGVLGKSGKGLCYGIQSPVTIITGTFGKSFGCGGSFIACNKEIQEHLLQTSGAFRYTTALAPPMCAAALAALNLIQENPNLVKKLQTESIHWRRTLNKHGWTFPEGIGPIIPLLMGTNQKALKYQQILERKGILCVAIRPPTVPEGQACLRLVVRENLPKETLQKLLLALQSP
ncbi:8-amino-7-oxononanoate synthase [Prochlorococcus sp. MIT 1223]|uniref:aminotransferase class I/II-fold pyridoxal phosphate-dependent enzyme n=1 Tax=Prochlorococcus sp. MIT 1223 TaxID=3096217 RepID=UPI002A759813|nr:8-amino-7-oxononanoate synthase [Prochlorococcus sp. MIT 1223]